VTCRDLRPALWTAAGRHAHGLVLGRFELIGEREVGAHRLECEFRAAVKNLSHQGDSLTVAARLTSESPTIEIRDGMISFGVVPPGGRAISADTFTVRLDAHRHPRPRRLRWNLIAGRGLGVVGPEGGALASSDGRLRLDFPAGALSTDTVITAATRTVPPEAGFVGGLVYELGPDGLVFAQPVRLTLGYDPAAVSGPETALRIGKLLEGGVGEFAADPAVDTALRTVSGSLSGFSSYGVTTSTTPFSFDAQLQGDRTIRVSWTSGGGSLTVERASCVYPQVCGNPVPIQPPDSSFIAITGGATGDFRDTSVPTVAAIYWYRIRNATRVFDTRFVVIFGLPTPPGPATGFTATPEPDGDIRLAWDPSGEPDVSFVLTREVCGAEEPLTELPASATSFTDSRAFGVAPGAVYTYRLSRSNSAGSSGPVSATATSPVAPGECPNFTLNLARCDVAVPSGASTTVEVQIQRVGSPLNVSLSLEPRGNFSAFVDHSFTPEISTDGNSLLTLTDLGGSDRVSAIIRGRDSLIPGTTCFTPISVHFTGTAVPVTLTTYRGREPGNALWAVARVGDAAWEPLQGASGRYDFTASTADGGRYSIAVACGATDVRILELTTSETTAPSVQCPGNDPSYLIQGAFQNLPATHCVGGSVGASPLASCYTQSYAAFVPAGTHDFIATVHPFSGSLPNRAPDAIRLVRDLVVSGPTNYPLDLAGAVAATPGLVQITPSATSGFVVFRTGNRARSLLGYSDLNTTQFAFGGVPFASQRTGDIHELSVGRLEETRRIFFRAPADHLVDLSNPLVWGATSVSEGTASSHRRLTLDAERVTGASGYDVRLVSLDPTRGEVEPPRSWRSFVSTGWLDASGLGSPFAYTTADLSAAPGFDPAWGLHTQPGSSTSYNLTAHAASGTLTTLLQALAGDYGSVGHGDVWRSAVRNGSVP
jgi:hypothetical protein